MNPDIVPEKKKRKEKRKKKNSKKNPKKNPKKPTIKWISQYILFSRSWLWPLSAEKGVAVFFPWVCQCCQVILTIVSGDHTLTLCTALLILLFTLFSISDNASIAFQFFSRNSYIPQKRNERVKHSLIWKGHESRLILTNVISSRESVQFYAKTKPVSSLYMENMVYRFKYFLIQDSNTQLLTMNKLHTSLAVQCLTTKHSTWYTTFLAPLGIFEWRNVKWFPCLHSLM